MIPALPVPDLLVPDIPRGRRRPVVLLIDGRSGAGKTTLAAALAARRPGSVVLHLEDVYPGWDGLDAASATLVRDVLQPLRAGRQARWRRWDWTADVAGDWCTPHPSPALAPLLIVEGVGSLSRAARRLADRAIWIELDADTRKRRALGRDGDGYAPHWDRWAAQEAAFIARENPRALADVVLFGR